MRSHQPRPGLTLLELLVVVTIIAILLAVLIPVAESARTQAKMAICTSSQKAIVGASLAYAADHNNYYPNRDANNNWDGDANVVRWTKGALAFDLRAKFQPYIKVDVFTDPMMGGPKVDDASYDPPGVVSDKNIFGGYALYGGLHRKSKGYAAMERVGQSIEIEDWVAAIPGPTRKYNILTGDWDMYRNGTARSGHPDNLVPPTGRPRYAPYQVNGTDKVYFSAWISAGSASRPVTLNFGYGDGSVVRIINVVKADPRMAKARPTDAYLTGRSADHPTVFMEIPRSGSPTSGLESVYVQLPKDN